VQTLKDLIFLKKYSLLLFFLEDSLGVAFPVQSAVQVDSQVTQYYSINFCITCITHQGRCEVCVAGGRGRSMLSVGLI